MGEVPTLYDYEIVFNVVLRTTGESIENIENTLTNYANTLGDCISEIYEDCIVVPFAWREVDSDDIDIVELLDHIYIETETESGTETGIDGVVEK